MIGSEEGWPITLSTGTGEVWLLDPSDFVRRLYRYARSSSQFLDALLLAARYQPPCVPQPPDYELSAYERARNNDAAVQCAVLCAAAAGLERDELNPYRGLLGLVD